MAGVGFWRNGLGEVGHNPTLIYNNAQEILRIPNLNSNLDNFTVDQKFWNNLVRSFLIRLRKSK